MKLKFTVLERLSFGFLFPKDDDMITLRLARDIKNKLNLSEEEIKRINLRSEKNGQGSNYVWDHESTKKVDDKYEADFTEAEMRFLKERVNKLNDAKQIPDSSLTLCEKIADGPKTNPGNYQENNRDKETLKKVS